MESAIELVVARPCDLDGLPPFKCGLLSRGWLEHSDQHEENKEVYAGLTIKLGDGTDETVGHDSTTWVVNGDAYDGPYWSTKLYFQSPSRFCNDGCEEVKFSVRSKILCILTIIRGSSP